MQICEMGRSLVEVWHSQGVVRLRFPKKIWTIVIGLVRYALCTNKFIFFHLTGSWTDGLTTTTIRVFWLLPGMDSSGQSPWGWCTWKKMFCWLSQALFVRTSWHLRLPGTLSSRLLNTWWCCSLIHSSPFLQYVFANSLNTAKLCLLRQKL